MLLKFIMHVHIWVLSFRNIGQSVYEEGICSGSRSCDFLRGAYSFQKRNILSYGSSDFRFRAFIKISINSNYYNYYISNIYCCVLAT
jgi:hypothetical protein